MSQPNAAQFAVKNSRTACGALPVSSRSAALVTASCPRTGDQRGVAQSVLPKLQLASGSVWVVHPPARNLPAKVSAFRDLVVEALATS